MNEMFQEKYKKLSFVIPCYNSESIIVRVIEELKEKMLEKKELGYEIILVNDASPDQIWSVISCLSASDNRIIAVDLAKNAGKHAALLAGYSLCNGDIIVSLDDDFQCPVDYLWDLLAPIIDDDYDITIAKYDKKKQSTFKNFGSKINERMLEFLLNKPKELQMSNFFAMKKFIKDEMLHYKNPYPYISGLHLQSTDRIVNVPMKERERGDGEGNFTFGKSLRLLLNGLTAFSVKPLRLATVMGFLLALGGFIYAVFIIIRKLCNPSIIAGYSSIMVMLLIIGGMIMMLLGIIGEYLGRIYISINNAPQYVIREIRRKDLL